MKELQIIQFNLKAPKSQRNNFGNYNYRSCEDILEAVKPLLAENNCTLTLSDSIEMLGSGENYAKLIETYNDAKGKRNEVWETHECFRIYVKATATLTNSTGESVQVTAFAREEETKKGMDGSQITGAASSYARKYALNGLFAIDDTKDSDATNTHGKEKNTDANLVSQKAKEQTSASQSKAVTAPVAQPPQQPAAQKEPDVFPESEEYLMLAIQDLNGARDRTEVLRVWNANKSIQENGRFLEALKVACEKYPK